MSSSASRPAALFALARPVNGIIAAAAVLVGAFVSGCPARWGPAFLGAGCAFAAASAANALNDALDCEADRLNRPERPIPSGTVTAGAAVGLAVTAYVCAAALGAAVGSQGLLLVCAWIVLTTLYSRWLKGVPVAGNVVVSLVSASPFLLGGLSQRKPAAVLVPCALAFLLHLAREAIKDAEDVAGDAEAGVRTLAVVVGPRAALAMARVVIVVLMAVAVAPFAIGLYGWGYLAVVVVIEAVLVWLLVVTGSGTSPAGLRRASEGLKLAMFLGLLAFVLGVL